MGNKTLVGVFITFADVNEMNAALKMYADEFRDCDAMQSMQNPLKVLVCKGEEYDSLINGMNANHIKFSTGSRINLLNNASSMQKYFREKVYATQQ